MNTAKLEENAKKLVDINKGILAADESNNSCQKRFEALDIECTEETRRRYRQVLLATPNLGEYLSGVILYDETFWQNADSGEPFRDILAKQGIMPGIKVDQGLIDLPGFPEEKITKGLDDLPERLATYASHGAVFAKWRSVITIGESIPTDACIDANAFVLARYARLCQENDIVPIVEPEVLFDGKHTIERCNQVMEKTLMMLFDVLRYYKVHLPGVILKTSMVLPGKDSGTAINNNDVASRTSQLLRSVVPEELGGVVFLSGGQTPADAFKNLSIIKSNPAYPWGLTFSYSRAIQDPVLKTWAIDQNEQAASEAYIRQLEIAKQATLGQLNETSAMDNFVSRSQDL